MTVVADGRDPELDRFAQRLMQLVRDRAIAACDRLASGAMAGPDGERWRELTRDEHARRALGELIPDIVDRTLFELLDAVDNDRLPLGWQTEGGSLVGLEELGSGEMGGWLMASDGWRAHYSAQRFFDPLGNLRLDLGDGDADGPQEP